MALGHVVIQTQTKETGVKKLETKPLASILTFRPNERGSQKAQHAGLQAPNERHNMLASRPQTKDITCWPPGPKRKAQHAALQVPIERNNILASRSQSNVTTCWPLGPKRKAQHASLQAPIKRHNMLASRPQSKDTICWPPGPNRKSCLHRFSGKNEESQKVQNWRVCCPKLKDPFFLLLPYFCLYISMQFNMVVIV